MKTHVFAPLARSCPLLVRMMEQSEPHAAETGVDAATGRKTRWGVLYWSCDPRPSLPLFPLPHAYTVPSAVMDMECQ